MLSKGNICIMTHSFFSNVIRIVSTQEPPKNFAKYLSDKSPGEYQVFFSLYCEHPNNVKDIVQKSLTPIECVKEFYDATPEQAVKLIKRETMKIASFSLS